MVKKYGNHPIVNQVVSRLETAPLSTMPAGDVMYNYLRTIGQYRLLTAEDEQVLFGWVEKGLSALQEYSDGEPISEELELTFARVAAAYQAMFITNQRLVVKIAKPWAKGVVPLEDLIDDGNLGLAIAIRRFDITRGLKFSTMATWWIRQSITRELADTGRLIRLPVHRHEEWISLRQDIDAMGQELGRPPTLAEIAAETKRTELQVADLLRQGRQNLQSLNAPLKESEDAEMGDIIPDENTDYLAEYLENTVNRSEVLRIIADANLSGREALVLSLRFRVFFEHMSGNMMQTGNGTILYDRLFATASRADKQTLDLVGELLGVTRERIRQIEATAMKKLKARA